LVQADAAWLDRRIQTAIISDGAAVKYFITGPPNPKAMILYPPPPDHVTRSSGERGVDGCCRCYRGSVTETADGDQDVKGAMAKRSAAMQGRAKILFAHLLRKVREGIFSTACNGCHWSLATSGLWLSALADKPPVAPASPLEHSTLLCSDVAASFEESSGVVERYGSQGVADGREECSAGSGSGAP